jgi:GT2 family glycosyltransferase
MIMIGMCYEPRMYTYFAMKTMLPLFAVPVPWAEKTHRFVRGVPIPNAREQIVESALKDPNVTHILWVDTDEICIKPDDPNAALDALYQCNEPIVSGLYRAKQAVGFNYAMWMEKREADGQMNFAAVQSFNGNWLQVDAVGMGFCLVRTEVYRKIPPPWYPWPTHGPSEDFSFCIKARQAGYKINVYTDVQLRHLGELAVDVDSTIKTLEV